MLYVSDAMDNNVTIDDELNVNGDEPLKTIVSLSIDSMNPRQSQANNLLAYIYYKLINAGFDIEADSGDLDANNVPDDAES